MKLPAEMFVSRNPPTQKKVSRLPSVARRAIAMSAGAAKQRAKRTSVFRDSAEETRSGSTLRLNDWLQIVTQR